MILASKIHFFVSPVINVDLSKSLRTHDLVVPVPNIICLVVIDGNSAKTRSANSIFPIITTAPFLRTFVFKVSKFVKFSVNRFKLFYDGFCICGHGANLSHVLEITSTYSL